MEQREKKDVHEENEEEEEKPFILNCENDVLSIPSN